MKKTRYVFFAMLILMFSTLFPTLGQSPTIITMTAPEYLRDVIEDRVIPVFEDEHRDIQVEFVFTESSFLGNPLAPADNEENDYFQNLRGYASAADVLYTTNFNLSPYATAAGAFLDLEPLVSVDSTVNMDDYFPAAWQAFQWDDGFWAMPLSMNVQVIVYNIDKFDAAGLNYPTESWTIADFVRAAEALQTLNAQGKVEFPPLTPINIAPLLYSAVGPMYDASTQPYQPDFSHPDLIPTIQPWIDYWQTYDFADNSGYSSTEIAMALNFPHQLQTNGFNTDTTNWGVSLLPGGRAAAQVTGFAISSGTAHPEEAYTLINFLSKNIDLITRDFGATPARRSLVGSEPDDDAGFFFALPEFEPEIQSLIDAGRESAIPPSELLFADTHVLLRRLVANGGMDIASAFEEIETRIQEAFARAAEEQSTPIVVAAPELSPELAPGEIVLNFGLNANPILNTMRDEWQDMVDSFADSHPTVGDVNLDDQIYGPDSLDPSLDCYYDGYSQLAYLSGPVEYFLALDPFTSADPDFVTDDFLPGLIEQSQINGVIYGYPVTLQPMVMWINVDKFEAAGLPVPEGTWTVSDFSAALTTFAELREDPDEPIVKNGTFGATALLMLIGSYGGQPIDFSTDPPTYNLTDTQNLVAMEQVIELARDNLIAYDALLNRGMSTFTSGLPERDTINMDVFGGFSFSSRQQSNLNDQSSPMRAITFPTGEYIPMSFQIGTIFITSETSNPEACYDWIKHITQRPELFSAMPARQSQLDEPALAAMHGEDVVTFYRQIEQQLTAPNTLIAPSPFIGSGVNSRDIGAQFEPNFLYHALDSAILENTDVAAEMAQAEANIQTYRECADGIEPMSIPELQTLSETDQDAGQDYIRQFVDCAVNILPELREFYSFYYQDQP